ncbi:alpha/beta hydrolase family protein [Streptomyces orinoci]|uniref:Prolyl oligopeptidase family serine peptidase n=1 Tax=Streptomyces orinoci TaxID=67339 RepID=A0ABV3K5E1_STRON|nr:prolyl oligopeptidase family serine peptidase [Streptomyces orinoci]
MRISGGVLAAGTALAVAAAAGACAPQAARSAGPADPALPAVQVTDHTYTVPQPLAPAAPGTPIAVSAQGPAPQLGNARRWTVLYHSTASRGTDTAVSGTLLLPNGTPPHGGWPVVSWAHGTTGVADKCAPSHTANLGYNAYAQELRALLGAGYAVAATDYAGLGTPGMHTYLVGPDEGNAVVDIVTAARRLLPGLAPTWFAIGHSQGGQAALFAANSARRAPDLRFGGAVALAPASHLETMLPGVIASHESSELSFALYSLAGLSATDPSVDLRRMLGPVAGRTAARVLGECLKSSYGVLKGVSTEQTLPLSPDQLRELGAKMGAYGDPDRTAVKSPVLVVQGGADQDVPPQWTAEVVGHLRALGSPSVTDRTYPGADHDQVLGQSICDLLAFMAEHGGRPVGGCAPYHTDLGLGHESLLRHRTPRGTLAVQRPGTMTFLPASLRGTGTE